MTRSVSLYSQTDLEAQRRLALSKVYALLLKLAEKAAVSTDNDGKDKSEEPTSLEEPVLA